MSIPLPTEEEEMTVVAQWLDYNRIKWFHPQNEGKHKPQYRAKMARLGLKAGVPDIIIVEPPPCGGYTAAAIELKRRKGGKLSKQQEIWLEALSEAGWYAAKCNGANEALSILQQLGYGKRRK
jgi:hypothetical protein